MGGSGIDNHNWIRHVCGVEQTSGHAPGSPGIPSAVPTFYALCRIERTRVPGRQSFGADYAKQVGTVPAECVTLKRR